MKAASAWPDTCSATALAALLGIGARRIRELAEAGVIPRSARGRYAVAEAVKAYCLNLREQAAGRAGGGDGEALDLATERAMLARSQRAAVDLRLARDRAELVDATAVRLQFAAMVAGAVSRLRSVPSKSKARIPTLTVRDIEELEKLIDDALAEVADGAEAAP